MLKVKTNTNTSVRHDADFSGQTIYVGLDVHKRSWNAAMYLNDQYLRNMHQPPSPHQSKEIQIAIDGLSSDNSFLLSI